MSASDVDGDGKPELLLAQKNFIRAVVLTNEAGLGTNGKPAWSFFVKEQINGASSDSRIAGAAPLRNGTNAIASIFLLDSERKALTLCERDAAGVWQVVRNLPLPVSDFTSLRAVALGSSNGQQHRVPRGQRGRHHGHERARCGNWRNWTATKRRSRTAIWRMSFRGI